jgi:hypothetical protein
VVFQSDSGEFSRLLLNAPELIKFYTHLKMIFGKIQKQFCPSKVLGAFCPGITATKIWFFEKPKTKPVLV